MYIRIHICMSAAGDTSGHNSRETYAGVSDTKKEKDVAIHTCVQIHTCICMYVCVCVCMSVRVRTSVCVCANT